MKQDQTIDDILKMLKDSVNAQPTSTPEKESFEAFTDPISEDVLKEQLQKQFGEASENAVKAEPEANPYVLDDVFLQEAVEVKESISESDNSQELEESEEDIAPWETLFEEVEEAEKRLNDESIQNLEVVEDGELIEEVSQDVFEEEVNEEVDEELEEEAEEEFIVMMEEPHDVPLLAMDYVNEDEEALEYEILPRLDEEALTALILRDYSTDAVPVNDSCKSLTAFDSSEEEQMVEAEEEMSDFERALAGVTYATPALNAKSDVEEESAYDLMRQLGCEDEWENKEIPTEESVEDSEETTEFESYSQTEKILATYRTKKIQEIVRLVGVILGSVILFFYETLPMFGVAFTGMVNYQEYIGAYLLIGFQVLLICTVIFGKRMAHGTLRLFSLRPNLYSLAALAVIFTGFYDIIVLFTVREWMVPFHFLTSLLLVLLAVGEYLMLSREIKAFSIFSSNPDRKKYTLHHHTAEDPCVQKMKRGGLSEEAKVAVPERCEFPIGFFRSIRREEMFGTSMVSFLLIPALILSLIASVVTMLLHWEFSVTILTAMSVMMVTLPLGAILAVCFPLWISSERLSKRQIALMGQQMIEEIADTDVLVFEDVHLFRQCTTTDTGFAFYEKTQTATILGCMECLYSKIGGPLAGAFSNIPEQYRFEDIKIRRIVKGGVEAIVDRKHILLVGDTTFMSRYGLSFHHAEETAGRTTIFISLNGKISAKMSVRYQPEPIFEMLAERMNQEGIQCVIKTFDPMISAATVSMLRSFGDAPISVVHQNLSDLNKSVEASDSDTTAVLSVASRFKLIEAMIWSKALVRIRRANRWILGIFSTLGVIAMGVLIGFQQIERMNQYWFILWGILANVMIVCVTLCMLPKKKCFSVDACREEWQKKQQKEAKKQQKKKGKK